MRYWKITATTPYCGTDETVYIEAETEEEAIKYADDFAYENGESYSYCHTGWNEDFKDEEDEADYYDQCTANVEEVTKEEYDNHDD